MGGPEETAGIAGLESAYADVNGVRLHYVHAGTGPLVVLLHGFPDFWYSWRHQIPALVADGYHVAAPDMRGYNLSDKPRSWRRYAPETLAQDIASLIEHFSEGKAFLAGHDWGAAVAYYTAMLHPQTVAKLAIVNAPHPERMVAGLRTARQLRKSWYMFFFQLPALPEWLLARDDFSFAKRSLRAHSSKAFTDADLDLYVQAWSHPGALTGPINYYRAALRQSPRKAIAGFQPIHTPTLVIWGMRDAALGSELAAPSPRLVPNARVERLLDAKHWAHLDAPAKVNDLLTGHFSA